MINTVLAQAAIGGGGILGQVFLFGSIILIMYFFMIRPQQKKQKEQQAYVDSLKAGDKVVTIGGAHGTIVSVREKTVVVEVDASKGVRIVFLKTAISKDASSQLTAE